MTTTEKSLAKLYVGQLPFAKKVKTAALLDHLRLAFGSYPNCPVEFFVTVTEDLRWYEIHATIDDQINCGAVDQRMLWKACDAFNAGWDTCKQEAIKFLRERRG